MFINGKQLYWFLNLIGLYEFISVLSKKKKEKTEHIVSFYFHSLKTSKIQIILQKKHTLICLLSLDVKL